MPKFQGVIGFSTTVETTAGVWEEQITERNYCVEITRNTRKLTNSEQLNDNLDITNEFSILADPLHALHKVYGCFMEDNNS